MNLDTIATSFGAPSGAIDEDRILLGTTIFLVFIATLFMLRFSSKKYIEWTRWFVDQSFRFALWAAAWCCLVLLLRSALGWTHEGLPYVALGPIMLILLSLFVLSLLEISVAWANTALDVLKRLKHRD